MSEGSFTTIVILRTVELIGCQSRQVLKSIFFWCNGEADIKRLFKKAETKDAKSMQSWPIRRAYKQHFEYSRRAWAGEARRLLSILWRVAIVHWWRACKSRGMDGKDQPDSNIACQLKMNPGKYRNTVRPRLKNQASQNSANEDSFCRSHMKRRDNSEAV